MAKYKVGDSVKVKDNFKDPDFEVDIRGWQGRIVDINDTDDELVEVQWDSVTLKEMPDDFVTSCFTDGFSIESMFMSTEELEPAKPRDKKTDLPNTLQEIYAKHDQEYKTELESLVESMFGLQDLDEDDWDEDDEIPIFDIDQFFIALKIEDKKEQKLIESCFGKGLETYYLFIYGYDKYGKKPTFLINERMGEPYIFGFGMVEVMRHPKIGNFTKAQIANYTLQIIEPEEEYGIPYGLVVLLSHVADGGLPVDIFRAVMQLTPGQRDWANSWKASEIITLSDWLITSEELPDQEKLWWLWYISSAFSNNAHAGKKAVNHWLTHENLSNKIKRDLCWAWLTKHKRPGVPPPIWRLAEAQYQGDIDTAVQIMRELGTSEADIITIQEELKQIEEQDPLSILFGVQTPMFIDPIMIFIHMPNWVKRLSIPELIHLGEDPLDVCSTFLDADRDYGSEATNQGVADAILEFQDQIPQNEIRTLIEKGLQIPQVQTRKTFYTLSTEFYGNEYLLKTQEDNAASIRKWGAKQLQKFS